MKNGMLFVTTGNGIAEMRFSRGIVATIDADDVPKIAGHRWYVSRSRGRAYIQARERKAGRDDCLYLHRVIHETPPGYDTDHINGNPLDNRKCNLRTATRSQNNRNRVARKDKANGTSMFVFQHGRGWCVRITGDHGRFYLGGFISEQHASKAARKLSRLLHGEFAARNLTPKLTQ